ncbi:hypothetical protein [Mycolicibacter minnesotensis]
MTADPLQVSPDGLAALAGRCRELAQEFSVASLAAVESDWQANAAAVNRGMHRADNAAAVSAERMRATGDKLTAAATGFGAYERYAVHRFSRLPSHGPVST